MTAFRPAGACALPTIFGRRQRVLILGATGNAGRMAIQVAKGFGAAQVIAAGRDPARLGELGALGADETCTFDQLTAAAEVDVVLGYVWGPPAARAMTDILTAREDRSRQLTWIEIGSVAGDFLARNERQGNPREAAAEEPDIPRADTRAMDPHQRLSRRGYWVWQLAQLYAADPVQLLRQCSSHGSSLLTLHSCRPRVTLQVRQRIGFWPADAQWATRLPVAASSLVTGG